MMTFGSVCSGIEAASVAWHGMGWRAAWLAEIEPFPSAVLAHHYPDVPNLGDMTTIADKILSGDVAVPCMAWIGKRIADYVGMQP
jgi:DNA (cytosine-5)-methyltransferase 1